MKRLLALFMAIVILCSVSVIPASAAEKIPANKITHYTYENRVLKSQYVIGDVLYANMTGLTIMDSYAPDHDYDTATNTYTFSFGDHKGSMKSGSKTAYLDGVPVTLSYAPIWTNEMFFAPLTDVVHMLGLKANIRKKTATQDYIRYDNWQHPSGGTKVTYIKKGQDMYYYEIVADMGKTNYTAKQLAFMQGLSAPMFLHNIDRGAAEVWGQVEGLSHGVKLLHPLTGVISSPGDQQSYKNGVLRGGWGITTRGELISSIEALLKNGNSGNKILAAYDNSRAVMLSQAGNLVGYLTAEEAVTYGMKAAKSAQKQFTSWTEYGEYYMKGARNYLVPTGFEGAAARQLYVEYLYKGNAFKKVKWDINLNAPSK